MKPIVLKRTLKVHAFDTIASIAVPESRPDLLAVVHLAAERGEVWGRDIGRDLLGMDDGLGWRVLERCQRLGLVTREGRSGPFELTELGELAVEDEQIFLPERAAYRFYWVDDPLLPEVLLGFRGLESARDAQMRDDARDARAGQGPKTSRCPAPLQTRLDVVTKMLHDGGLVRLLELGDGFTDQDGTIELSLTLRVDAGPMVRLQAQDLDRELDASGRVGQDHAATWRQLVRQALGIGDWQLDDWAGQFGAGTIGRSFADVHEAGLRSFEERLSVDEMHLSEAGRFQGTSVTVDVVPADLEDANAWATWLVWDGLHDHVSRQELEAHRTAVEARFRHHNVEIPHPGLLLQEAYGRLHEDTKAWRVVAPADLGLWEVTNG
jgi:hypothetical protein